MSKDYIQALESAIASAYKYIDALPEPDYDNRKLSSLYEENNVMRMLLKRSQYEKLRESESPAGGK